jgi:hypothetical protein
MTTKTKLSNEETAQWHRHSCLCAFAAPAIQAMSNTALSRNTEFLIANLELEFESNRRKQSPLKFSNRKYFTIFSFSLPHFSANTPSQSSNPNRNSRKLEFRLTPALSLLTRFLTATKSIFSPFASAPAFLLAKAFPAI